MTKHATIVYFAKHGLLCFCGGDLKPVAHHTGDGWTWGGK